MEDSIFHLLKFNNKIYRTSQVYLDKTLKEYGLTSGTYPYLLLFKEYNGISQNKISEYIGHDKAMSTRTIAKLMELGYLTREKDEEDSRANKIYTTEKANVVIDTLIEIIHRLIEKITEGLSDEEKSITMSSLERILVNVRNLQEECCKSDKE